MKVFLAASVKYIPGGWVFCSHQSNSRVKISLPLKQFLLAFLDKSLCHCLSCQLKPLLCLWLTFLSDTSLRELWGDSCVSLPNSKVNPLTPGTNCQSKDIIKPIISGWCAVSTQDKAPKHSLGCEQHILTHCCIFSQFWETLWPSCQVPEGALQWHCSRENTCLCISNVFNYYPHFF